MEKNIVLEVGMSDGFDTQRIYDRFRLPIYGFEPVPKMYEQTKERFKNNPRIHVHPYAVDVEDSEKDFYLSNPSGRFTDGTNRPIHPYGCSSLYPFADDIHEKWKGRPDFNTVETIKVQTIRLETFLDQQGFDGSIVFIHCDAQGNDINVLRSLGKYLSCVESGVIECAAKTNLYKGSDNSVNSAKKFFSENGFTFSVSGESHEADIKFKRL
jgi:FkbM family methyltransferase